MMMKISKCKKELARIISENGGWRDEMEFSVQNGEHGRISFSTNKPVRHGQKSWMAKGGFKFKIEVCKPLPNWHQIILSRVEYFHLYPAPDADGWIEWSGGECPVGEGDRIDVKFSDGDTLLNVDCDWDWGKHAYGCNIIAYRLHKPQKSEPQYCESVTRSIPEPIAAPTIDQLLQDWRNADDYAKRKQAEADEAAAMRYERWQAVQVKAGEIGVTIGARGSLTSEHKLEITDWRDLQLNDIIEYVDGSIKNKIGMTGPVVEFATDATDGMMVRMKCDNGPNKGRLGWPEKWRFIRRP